MCNSSSYCCVTKMPVTVEQTFYPLYLISGSQYHISAINAAQNNIGTADNCHRITHFVAAQEFRQNLQIDKGRSAHLHPPWIFSAIADQIVAVLSAAVFDGEIGLPPWRSQGYRHTGSN